DRAFARNGPILPGCWGTGNASLFVPRGATRRRARSGRAGQAPNTVASALPPEGFERRGGEMGQRARIHLSGLTGTQAQAHVGGAQEGATPHTTAGSMAHVKSRRTLLPALRCRLRPRNRHRLIS